jgi:hypothetical protein
LLADEPREHAHAMRIEPDRRLVEEEQLAPAREHARDRDALRLATRQLRDARPRLGELAIEADAREPLGDFILRLVPRPFRMPQRDLEVAAHVEVIEQRAALRNQAELAAVEIEVRCHDVEAGGIELFALEQDARERRLAGARATEQHDDLAFPDIEIDAVDQHAAVGERHLKLAHRQRDRLLAHRPKRYTTAPTRTRLQPFATKESRNRRPSRLSIASTARFVRAAVAKRRDPPRRAGGLPCRSSISSSASSRTTSSSVSAS